jgi:hypothetical protein
VSTVNVPVPSGTAANQIALVALEMWEVGNPTVTPPSGFTLITTVVSGSQKLKVFWKRLTGADAGNYSFSWTGAQWTIGHCVLFSGALTSGDPIGTNWNSATSASGTSVPSTSVTVAFQPGLAHFVANENSATHTAPTSFAEVQESNYLASNYRIPGSTGTFTASGGTMSASTLSLAFLAALQPASGGGSTAIGTVTETDSSQAFGKRKSKAAVTLTETDTAPAIARSKRRSVTLAAETDAALPITRSKRKSVSTASSVETAVSLGRLRSRPLETAASTEQALPIGKVKRKPVGTAAEADAAISIGNTSGISQAIGTAVGTETALPIGYRRSRAIGTAVEVDTAGEASFMNPAWRLVMPAISERYTIRGNLAVTISREATVFGDENGLFTTQNGSLSDGSDEYGAIPYGTKYIWFGGHVNTTDDPAVKNLWLAHGFEVENYATG